MLMVSKYRRNVPNVLKFKMNNGPAIKYIELYLTGLISDIIFISTAKLSLLWMETPMNCSKPNGKWYS